MRAIEPIQFVGHCYVLLQGNWVHPIAYRRHELMWYPERGLTLLDTHQYRPYVRSVVTENPWIIGMYDRENVRVIYDDEVDTENCGKWVMPNHQTYGCSANSIMCNELGIRATIPAMALDGGKEIQKYIAEYANLIEKAKKIYGHSNH